MKTNSIKLFFCFGAALTLAFMALPPATPAQDTPTAVTASAGEETHPHSGTDSLAAGDSSATGGQVSSPPEEESAPPTFWDFLFADKYIAFFILMAAGLILLLGRWINLWVRLVLMAAAFVLFGLDLVFTLHPSPMCAVTKLFMFRFTQGEFFVAFLAIFAAIMVPSLIVRKLFCGWVCPLGAFQELVNKIPHRFKWKQFDFASFNAVRMALLALFFLTFFFVRDQILYLGGELGADTSQGAWAAFSAYSVYNPVNFFELLHWSIDATFYVMMPVLVISSLVLYRPFCYLICPIGAITWLLEKISPGRIRVDMSKCTECGLCEEQSPCPTIKPMHDASVRVLPDCTSCGECIKACPEGAIRFRFLK